MQPKFVKFIPRELDEGIIYVSKEYGTASHKCCCGCGKEVVTTLSPTDWQFTVEQGRISIFPSIGNWNFPCRSHYWIRKGAIVWGEQWSQEEIDAGRYFDSLRKERYFESLSKDRTANTPVDTQNTGTARPEMPTSLWIKLRNWLS